MRLLPFRTRHRRGQALVEFALIMPLLILLVFGVIEMARLMQTLITLQNSARAATRYAAIGAIKWDIFSVPEDPTKPLDQRVLDGIVPCFTSDQRGTKDTTGPVQRYVDGEESLFATWYDGINCDPREEDHQQMRRDILRIFSVIHEAREVSSGISLGDPYNNYTWDAITREAAEAMLYDVWTTPYPGNHDQPGYFYVDVCADRQNLNALSTGGMIEPTEDNPRGNPFPARFVSLRNTSDVFLARGARDAYADSLPMCMLNENPPNTPNPADSSLENTGHRWWDAGGPGERVVVFVRFNHPWISPIDFGSEYITLQARRSSVNESFRAPKAVGAFQRSIPPGRDDENPPIEPPEETPPVERTNTPIVPDTPVPPSATPLPFDCNAIQLRWAPVPFSGNTMYVSIQNDNLDAILLTRVGLDWYASPSYPLMYARAFSLDNALHWQGGPPATTPQETIDTGTHGTVVAGATPIVGGQNTGIWTSVFLSGPPDMGSVFIIEDFEVEFRFEGPQNQNCNVLLVRPPRPTPTHTPIPTAGPSPTRTPDCATAQDISILGSNGVATIGYDTFDGSMYFTIVNSGGRPTYMTGFSFVWPSPTHPQIGRQAGDYYLTRVTVGGDGPADINTTLVWTAAGGRDQTGNTSTTAPYPPGTVSTSAEGTWQQNAVIPPGQTRVYFDFDGFPGSFPNAIPQLRNYHFNGTLFYVGCPTTGGPGGGPGSVPTGVIGVQIPSPTTTNTPRPTNPPQPTNTNTPITPTQPRTPTATRTPTRTLTPSNTPLPPTRPPIGGLTPTAGGGGED